MAPMTMYLAPLYKQMPPSATLPDKSLEVPMCRNKTTKIVAFSLQFIRSQNYVSFDQNVRSDFVCGVADLFALQNKVLRCFAVLA